MSDSRIQSAALEKRRCLACRPVRRDRPVLLQAAITQYHGGASRTDRAGGQSGLAKSLAAAALMR